MAASAAAAPATAKPAALRKGALVKVNRAAYSSSLEAGASDPTAPDYIFEGPGELLVVKGDYGQVRWNRQVPDVWLRMDQLEACSCSWSWLEAGFRASSTAVMAAGTDVMAAGMRQTAPESTPLRSPSAASTGFEPPAPSAAAAACQGFHPARLTTLR